MLSFTLAFSGFIFLFSTLLLFLSAFQLHSLFVSVRLPSLFDCVLEVSQAMWHNILHVYFVILSSRKEQSKSCPDP